MSQNRTNDPSNSTSTGTTGTGTGNPTSRGTGGAGTGATDAGTTRSTTGAGIGSSGSSASSGSMTTTAGSTTSTSPVRSSGGGGVGTQAQGYSEKIAGAASQAKDYVSDKMSVVGDKFKDLQNTDVKEVAENARQYARQNPGQALLISAAAGFLLGILLRGGRR